MNNSIHPRVFDLITIILIGINFMLPVRAEDLDHHRPHTIQVDGLGRISIAPDKADLTLSIEVQAKSAEAARDQAAAAMTSLIKAVKNENVADKDIQTRYVSLYPIYGQNTANKINGYQLANRVTVFIHDISKVSAIIDSAVKAGGNPVRVQDINFGIDNPEVALAQAREKAYANARTKAEQYAKLAGVTFGRAMHISEGAGGAPPMPTPYAEMSMLRGAVGASAPTPIQVGEQEVSVTVNVIFGVE
jgi:uncharacterized protein YggE